MMAPDRWPIRWLFNVPIHALTMEQVLEIVDDTIRQRKSLLIGVVNAAKMVNMRRDPELAQSVLSADLILADGMAVVWACRVLGRRLPGRIPGIDLMERLLDRGRERGYRFFCLGATEEVLSKAVEQIQLRYPGVRIVGQQHGYFTLEEEPGIVARIKATSPDVIFVAMTSPKKERFLARWSTQMAIPVCHGVGGSFDVIAGKVKRAPVLWQRLGMEWFYRVLQEPRRMFRRYAVTNTLFCWMLLCEWFRKVFVGGGVKQGTSDKVP